MTTVGADHLPQPLRKEGSKAVCPNNGQQTPCVVPLLRGGGVRVGSDPHFSGRHRGLPLQLIHSALCAAPPVACLIPSINFCCSCWASSLLGFSFSAFSKFCSTSR